jgi:C4-dicarboxylate-specific signal transduction histidine kinase
MEDPSLISTMVVADDRKIWNEHQCNIVGIVNGKGIRFRIRTLQGDTRWIEHTCRPVVDTQGNNLGVRANNRDITERELYKSKTQKLQTELIHVERVSTISALSYALAHEINQPLTSIRGYAQAALRFMDKGTSEEENLRKALQGIVADNKRAASIVSQLSDLVRKDSAKFKRIDLNLILKDVLNLLNSELILHRVSIKLDLDASLDRVSGDAVQLQQVFMNLVTNGIHAVRVQKKRRREITISTKAENEKELRILFCDTGLGIPADKLEEIFQPFHTTKAKGLGLGLAISKLIIESHDGKIWAENNTSGGATFIVILPFFPKTQ